MNSYFLICITTIRCQIFCTLSTYQVTLETLLTNLPTNLNTGDPNDASSISSGIIAVTALFGSCFCRNFNVSVLNFRSERFNHLYDCFFKFD